MLAGMPVRAADLSIAAASFPAAGSGHAATAKKATGGTKAGKRHVTRLEKDRRAAPARPQRIVMYNLSGDPVFRMPGALDDKSAFPPFASTRAESAVYLPAMTSAAPAMPASAGNADDAGIGFDCHAKRAYPGALPRTVTACYKLRIDKGWKTQTYLSKGFAASDAEWGGGVSVSYAH